MSHATWQDAGHARVDDATIVSEEVASKPDFYIFTTFVWVRRSPVDTPRLKYHNEDSNSLGHKSYHVVPQEDQPDLGLLPLHRDRLAAAAGSVNWPEVRDRLNDIEGLSLLGQSIATHINDLPEIKNGMVERRKVRLLILKDITIKVDSSIMTKSRTLHESTKPFMPTSLDHVADRTDVCQVTIDTIATQASNFTTHKTSHRPHYDSARERAHISKIAPTEKEVLLYNGDGHIMEASLCTVYFYRDGSWVTPEAATGCTEGVTRRLALERNLCQQGNVKHTDLVSGEHIWLSNAARGFFIGQILAS